MRSIPILVAGVVVALATQAGPADAQAVRQELTFGGGSHFEFLVPVHEQGDMQVEIMLADGTPVEAFLFSPRERSALVSAKGTGSVTLRYQIPYRVESWKPDEQWLVNVVLPTTYAEAGGTLRVAWPGDRDAAAQVLWRNAGPVDPAEQAAIAGYLRAMELAGHTGTNGNVARMVKIVQARLNALAGTPRSTVQNEFAAGPAPAAQVGLAGSSGPLTVSLARMDCFRETTWHAQHDADRPYVVAAVIPEPGQRAIGGQTRVHRFVHDDPGGRYSSPTNPLTVIYDNGEPIFSQLESGNPSEIVVALLEREHAGAQGGLQGFLTAVELFAMFRDVAGPDADRHLPWLLEVALCCGDALIGSPQVLFVRRNPGDPTEVVESLQFEGNDAAYGTLIQLSSARLDR